MIASLFERKVFKTTRLTMFGVLPTQGACSLLKMLHFANSHDDYWQISKVKQAKIEYVVTNFLSAIFSEECRTCLAVRN